MTNGRIAQRYEISRSSAYRYRLTNPLMSDLARRIYVNHIKREEKIGTFPKGMNALGFKSRVPGLKRG